MPIGMSARIKTAAHAVPLADPRLHAVFHENASDPEVQSAIVPLLRHLEKRGRNAGASQSAIYGPSLTDHPARGSVILIWRGTRLIAVARLLIGATGLVLLDRILCVRSQRSRLLDPIVRQVCSSLHDRGHTDLVLGTIPLDGPDAERIGPMLARLAARYGASFYRHGQPGQSLDELREALVAFNPQLTERYLVSPHGEVLPNALSLIAKRIADPTVAQGRLAR